jgi:phosphoribosylformylglycinamidine synthase PurS subunit
VPRVVVDVMLKPEILDPQGQAIARALPDLGFDNVTSVRQGKRFEIEIAADGDPLEVARRAAEAMLANPVIEDFTVHLAD